MLARVLAKHLSRASKARRRAYYGLARAGTRQSKKPVIRFSRQVDLTRGLPNGTALAPNRRKSGVYGHGTEVKGGFARRFDRHTFYRNRRSARHRAIYAVHTIRVTCSPGNYTR